jgi:hypothetical protein
MIKVLVVDDSAFMRRTTSRMLEKDEEVRVVGTASNGREAVEQVKLLKPDVSNGSGRSCVKPLGEFPGNIRGAGKATIRGDGKVIVILDIPVIVENKVNQKEIVGSQRVPIAEQRHVGTAGA